MKKHVFLVISVVSLVFCSCSNDDDIALLEEYQGSSSKSNSLEKPQSLEKNVVVYSREHTVNKRPPKSRPVVRIGEMYEYGFVLDRLSIDGDDFQGVRVSIRPPRPRPVVRLEY